MLKRPKRFLVLDLESLIHLKWKDLKNQMVIPNTSTFFLSFLIALTLHDLFDLSLGSMSLFQTNFLGQDENDFLVQV